MSRDTLISKYETLPVVAQKQVETFIEFLSQQQPTRSVRATKRRFTAVELQHHLSDLR